MGGERTGVDAALIPSGFTTIEYQSLRSLGRRGIHTVFGEVTGNSTAKLSRYCDETVTLPSFEDDFLAYRDRLIDLATRPDVRTIVPVDERVVYVLSKHREQFADHVSNPVPSFESLRNVHDRMRLAEVAEDAGVPVPETRLLTDVDDWDSDSIIKSRYNVLTSDYVESQLPDRAEMAKTVTHLRANEVPDVDEVIEEMGHTPIVQEFVPRKNEYMVGALCDHGTPLAMMQLHQIREDSYTGGGGVYRKSVYVPELDTVARELLDELDWHGLACIEYMEDANTGEFKLAEINPRLWQSLAPSIKAGADFPYYYWLLATGNEDEIDPRYELGVGSHFLQGELKHLASVLRDDSPNVERPSFQHTLWEILASCVEDPNFDTFHLDDPDPFVRGVLNGVRQRYETTRPSRDELRSLAASQFATLLNQPRSR